MKGGKAIAKGEKQLSYIKRWVDINFTGDTVCCALCPLMETYARKQCRRTGEMLIDDRITGYWCPLVEAPGNTPPLPDEVIVKTDKNGEVIEII